MDLIKHVERLANYLFDEQKDFEGCFEVKYKPGFSFTEEQEEHIFSSVVKVEEAFMKAELRITHCLSSAHITEDDMEWLGDQSEDSHFPLIARHEFGAYIYISPEFNGHEYLAAGVPMHIVWCMSYAHRLGANELKFDADAQAVDDLPVFD